MIPTYLLNFEFFYQSMYIRIGQVQQIKQVCNLFKFLIAVRLSHAGPRADPYSGRGCLWGLETPWASRNIKEAKRVMYWLIIASLYLLKYALNLNCIIARYD